MIGKRGQAAVEFLSTYGWAILVIAIVFAALAWLGIFNAATQVQDRCVIQGGVQCDSTYLTTTTSGSLWLKSVVVTNRLSDPIYICGLRCNNAPPEYPVDYRTMSCSHLAVRRLGPGETKDIATIPGIGSAGCYDYFGGVLTSGTRYRAGDMYSGNIVVGYITDYDKEPSTLFYTPRIFKGTITAKVQPQ